MKTRLLIIFLLASCSGFVSCQDRKPAQPSPRELTFVLPTVPSQLTDIDQRLAYVLHHYWDHFDFADTAYIHAPDVTEQAMVNYLDLMKAAPQLADTCLTRTMQQASCQPLMLDYLAGLVRKYCFDPNSPMRNERLYEPVCRYLTTSPQASQTLRSRAAFDLKLVMLNRVGSPANDFLCTLPDGRQQRMSSIRSPYLLIFFYNPDCESCASTQAEMERSAVLHHPDVADDLRILAFYPDEDPDIWRRHLPQMPAEWIHACDKTQTVLNQGLYDLKAMPTLYLLDADKRVLLKDARLSEVENFLKDKCMLSVVPSL